MYLLLILSFAVVGAIAWPIVRRLHRSGLDRCLVPYILGSVTRQPPRAGEPVHLILCIADHYEPSRSGAPPDVAQAMVDRWILEYPRLFSGFRDSDDRPPRHTFFVPIDEYDAAQIDALAGLCRVGYGEVEVHLHHDRDDAENLRQILLEFKELLASRHGLLSRHRATGELAYAFIHGNWALDNARPDGRWCGVNNELDVLRETGCYADFTLPSYPSPTQTRKINSLYYATDDPHRPRSHDQGIDVGDGPAPADALMLIQGPLIADWRRRRWALFPRVENGCIQGNQPATIDRVDAWLRARVQVPNRPDWYFVKLHTHGAREDNTRLLLGESMSRFHQALARRAEEEPDFHYHYVSAREMYNLIRAAESHWSGSVADARDFELAQKGDRVELLGQKECRESLH